MMPNTVKTIRLIAIKIGTQRIAAGMKADRLA
jgi:hypothetical protein